jgi:hypothetical protein
MPRLTGWIVREQHGACRIKSNLLHSSKCFFQQMERLQARRNGNVPVERQQRSAVSQVMCRSVVQVPT